MIKATAIAFVGLLLYIGGHWIVNLEADYKLALHSAKSWKATAEAYAEERDLWGEVLADRDTENKQLTASLSKAKEALNDLSIETTNLLNSPVPDDLAEWLQEGRSKAP